MYRNQVCLPKKKKKKRSVEFSQVSTRLFGQSNNFVWPIFAVLGPLSLTDRAKVLEGVVNSPAFLVLWNLNRLVLLRLPLRAPQQKKAQVET